MGLDHFLIEKGVHVIPDWAQQWQEAATSAVPGFVQKSVSAKQELLYQEVLRSNLHLIGRQALPADLQVCLPFIYLLRIDPISPAQLQNTFDSFELCQQAWHKRQLQGLFVLQADETINVAAAAKYRYQKSALHFGCVDIHQMRRNLPKSCRYEEAAEKRCLKLMLTDGVLWCLFNMCFVLAHNAMLNVLLSRCNTSSWSGVPTHTWSCTSYASWS